MATMPGVMIGRDPHKASNTIAVLERDETILTQRRFVNSTDGIDEMLAVVAAGHPERVWAVEGANGMGRAVAQRLVAAGEAVVDVPAKLSSRVRVYSTGHGTKTDRADAVATARAALHSKHLRWVQRDGTNTALKARHRPARGAGQCPGPGGGPLASSDPGVGPGRHRT